jgi:hypothetical protein
VVTWQKATAGISMQSMATPIPRFLKVFAANAGAAKML